MACKPDVAPAGLESILQATGRLATRKVFLGLNHESPQLGALRSIHVGTKYHHWEQRTMVGTWKQAIGF